MQFIIFHGSFAKVDTHWFSSFTRELSSTENNVLVPQFPVDDFDELTAVGEANVEKYQPKQSLSAWMKTFENDVLPQLEKDSMWVGHSMGNLLMLHILEKLNISISGAIFVIPFYKKIYNTPWQFDVVNDSFYKENFDFENLKKRMGFTYTLYSKNDPYVPNNDSLEFAYKLDSTTIPVQNGLHLGSKLKKFPLVEELAKSMVDYMELTSNKDKYQ